MIYIAKDKIIGALIMVIGVIIAIVYTLGSVVDLYMETLGGTTGGFEIPFITNLFGGIDIFSWRLFVVLPLWLLVILISIIAIWIGYSMLTPFSGSRMEVKRLHLFHSKNKAQFVFYSKNWKRS